MHSSNYIGIVSIIITIFIVIRDASKRMQKKKTIIALGDDNLLVEI